MYLTPAARRRAGEVLAASLEPGGVLLIGASDPLMDVAGLAHTRAPHGLAYHLAGSSAAEADVIRGASSPAPPRPPQEVRTPTRMPTPAPSPAPVGAPPQVDASLELRALVDDGRADEARQLLAAAIAEDPMDAQLRRLAATLLLDGADPAGAAREARASLYLDPERGVAHVLLAHSLRALGRAEAAEREYRRAAAVLARADGAGLDDAEAGLSALVQQLTEGAGRG
jgi:tetratricopeptide (TPR) repeat protein